MTETAPPRRSIRASAGLTVGANLLQFGILFVASVIIARLLTPDELGVFAIAMAANGLIFAFQNTGVAQFITAQEDLPPRRLGAILAMQGLQSLAMAAALLVAAHLLALLLDEPRLVPAIGILAIAAILAPVEMVANGLFQREMRFDKALVLIVGKAVTNAVVSIACALHGLSYASLSWGTVAGAAIGLVLAALLGGRRLVVPLNLDGWRDYWRFGSAMLSIVAVTNLCNRAALILLGRITDMASVGLFSRAMGMAEMIQSGLTDPLARLVLPTLAERNRISAEFRQAYLRALAVMTAVSWAAFGGLAVLAAPVIALVYGSPWLPAAPLLVWLCLARMLMDIVPCYVEVMVAAGRLPLLARPLQVRAVTGLVAFTLGAWFGLSEAAMARAAEAALGVALTLPLVRAAAGIGLGELARHWAASLAAAAAATAPAALWMQAHGWPSEVAPATLLGLVAAGVCGWLLVLALTGHEIWAQLRQLLPGGRRRDGR